jgi:aldose 1-epimerase
MAARAPLLLPLLCACACAAALGPANAAGRKLVGVYELKTGDFSVSVTNWGATITSVVLPDSKGAFDFPLILSPRIHPWRPSYVLCVCDY